MLQQRRPVNSLLRIFDIKKQKQSKSMCQKKQNSSQKSFLKRFISREQSRSEDSSGASPREETPSLTFSSSPTIQGTRGLRLLYGKLNLAGSSNSEITLGSESPVSNTDGEEEEEESLTIERVVTEWLESRRQGSV